MFLESLTDNIYVKYEQLFPEKERMNEVIMRNIRASYFHGTLRGCRSEDGAMIIRSIL